MGDLQHQFLDDYSAAFPTTPVYIGEHHRVNANQTEDLSDIFEIVGHNPLFLGISFFEFTVSYYKTGTEMDFGMFGYGNQSVRSMDYFGHEYPVRCSAPEPDVIDGVASSQSIADAVARVYGGHVDRTLLCGGGSGTPLPEGTTTSPSSSRSSSEAPSTTSDDQVTTSTSTSTGAAEDTSTSAGGAAASTLAPHHDKQPEDWSSMAAPRRWLLAWLKACAVLVLSLLASAAQ